MREVLVAPSYLFANDNDQISRGLYSYAQQIDNRGGEGATNPVSSLPGWPWGQHFVAAGQRVMVSYVGYPFGLQTATVLAQTLEAFERAVGWAGRGGTLVIALGHGFVRPDNIYVAMAPLRFFPAHRVHFEAVESVLAGDGAESSLDARRLLLLRIARLIRGAGLARVDFLSCQLGVGRRGRRLLQAAARAFARPVRGLRGDLDLAWVELGANGGRTTARVVPADRDCAAPRRLRPRAPFCVEYRDTIPTNNRLWRSASP